MQKLFVGSCGIGTFTKSTAVRTSGRRIPSGAATLHQKGRIASAAMAAAAGPPVAPARAFQPFELEEWQSRYETEVQYGLADSGVSAVRLEDLVATPEALQSLLSTKLSYPAVGGTPGLQAAIADWQGAAADNILVTVGAAEANAITVATLVNPEDHVVIMEPSYRQVWGCAVNAGAKVDTFPLDADNGWRPDLDALDRVVTPDTKLIAITNPNNPVGVVLTLEEMDRMVTVAERVGAWLLADEVYRGTERASDTPTPSFWGRCGYDRIICVGSLSKAFGMPGLRLGWLVAPPAMLQDMWRRHEYATISTATLSMALAEMALAPVQRQAVLARSRKLSQEGYARIRAWVDASDGLLSLQHSDATSLAFVRYHLDVPSVEVADAIRRIGNVLMAPGSHFGVEYHLRLNFGLEVSYMDAALAGVSAALGELAKEKNLY